MSDTMIARFLTDRDVALMRGLFESRILTIQQATALFFENNRWAAYKRILRLKNACYIGEKHRQRVFDQSILYLTKQGFETLRAGNHLHDFPAIQWKTMTKRLDISQTKLRHELVVNSVKAAFISCYREIEDITIPQFSTWPRLFSFKSKREDSGNLFGHTARTTPDGFIRMVHGLVEEQFYLEVDLSTETHRQLQTKIGAYLHHHANTDHPFRVLWVFDTMERRNNVAETLLRHNPPVLTMMWLTTLQQVLNDPAGAIWVRPLDYRSATTGTPFDPLLKPNHDDYRRDVERDRFIEKNLQLTALTISSGHPDKIRTQSENNADRIGRNPSENHSNPHF